MRIRLIQAGQADQVFDVPADEATLGRTQGVDVFVDDQKVSRRHAKIFQGTVVLDLGSANGTYVDGERISGAVLVKGNQIAVGDPSVILQFETPPKIPQIPAVDPDATMVAGEGAPGPVPAVHVAPLEPSPELADLKRDNLELRGRLESMKEELQARAEESGGTPEAKLAVQQLSEFQARYEKLKGEYRKVHGKLEALRAAQQEAPDADPLKEENLSLKRSVMTLQEELQSSKNALKEALAEAPKGPELPASDMFASLHRENAELRRRVQELELAPGGDGSEAESLRRKNEYLEEQLEELRNSAGQSAPSAASTGAGADSADRTAELEKLNAALEGRVRLLKKQLNDEKGATTKAAAAAAPKSAIISDPSAGVGRLLRRLVDDDANGVSPIWIGPPEEFFVLEQFRFLRRVERCVTRLAGEFLQILDGRTMVPGVEGNFCSHASEALLSPEERRPREEVVRYLDELSRWLVASVTAYRQSAKRFADQIRVDLSEAGLTANKPIPRFVKVAGQTDAELWKRAKAYLEEMTPDSVDERIDELARASAPIIVKSADPDL